MKAIFITGTSAALFAFAFVTATPGLAGPNPNASYPTLDIEKYFAGSAPTPSNEQGAPQSPVQSVEIERERPAAISNGGSYGIIAPLYLYSDPLSLIRLVNGDLAPTTFNISVVGVPSGNNLGTAQIVVPGAASLQKSISDILTAANATPGASDITYSFYIQSAGQLAGYQHIIFSNSSGFLENVSVCKYNLNQSFSAAAYAEGVINVHTSVLAGGTYPSQIEIHNYASTTQTYVLSVHEASTGALKGRASFNAAANSTYLIPFVSGIQEVIGWNPTSAEIHANVSLTTTTGTSAPQASIGHVIVNTRQTNTVLNMTNVCAVNAPPAIVATPTTPTAYCGTMQVPVTTPFPYNLMQYTLTASVASNGRVKGTMYGQYGDYSDGDSMTGTVTGSTFFGASSDGIPISGTISNGTFSGSASTIYGTIMLQGTTAACSQ